MELKSRRGEIKIKYILVENRHVLLDDEDFDYINECYDLKIHEPYVYCSPKKKYKKMGLLSMQLQKIIMCPEKKGRNVVVDHKDGNECNNQKENLRVCTHMENMRNRKTTYIYMGKKATSRFKGISWSKRLNCWEASIKVNTINIYLGLFSDEEAAANCYDYWAKIHFGEFAKLNSASYMSKEEWENFKITKNKTSKYRGVSYVDNKWVAQICHESKNVVIGRYSTELEGATNYNSRATELKGEKARLNIIDTN